MLLLVVACTLIDADGRVLIAQRPASHAYGGVMGISWRKTGGGRATGTNAYRELREEL